MKIYNIITEQVVNSEKIEELDDRFELTDVRSYEKTSNVILSRLGEKLIAKKSF